MRKIGSKIIWRGKPDYDLYPARGWFVAWLFVLSAHAFLLIQLICGSVINIIGEHSWFVERYIMTFRWTAIAIISVIYFVILLLAVKKRQNNEKELKERLKAKSEEVKQLEQEYNRLWKESAAIRNARSEEQSHEHEQELDSYEDENDDIRAAMLERMMREDA